MLALTPVTNLLPRVEYLYMVLLVFIVRKFIVDCSKII